MGDAYFNEIESLPIQLITTDIYKINKHNLLSANYDLIYERDDTQKKFITNSNIQTLTLNKHRDVKLLYNDRPLNEDQKIPLILEDSIKDIDRISYYDNLNNKVYKITHVYNSTKKLYSLYKLVKKIYESKDIKIFEYEITEEQITEILNNENYWNPLYLKSELYNIYDRQNDIPATIESLFNNDSSRGNIINNDLKKLFYIAILCFQNFQINIKQYFMNMYDKENVFLQQYLDNASEKIVLFDFINEKPYINLASNLINVINDGNGYRKLNIGYMYIINSIDDITNLHCKVLMHLLYTPKPNNSIMEDCLEYSYNLLKKIGNINIFRCLTEEREKAQKGDTGEGAGAGIPAKNMYLTYRPKDDKYESVSCSGFTKKGFTTEPKAKDDIQCTYGDMLNYVDNLDQRCYELSRYQLFEEINRFLSQDVYKYVPICFMFSINIHICNKLFKAIDGNTANIDFRRHFVIGIRSELHNRIREYIPYVIYIDTQEEIQLGKLVKSKLDDPIESPLLTMPEYHKLFFIVSTEDIDEIACPWLIGEGKEKEKYEHGDPWMPINSMKELIKKSDKYRKIIGFAEKYVPVFIASNFIKNILSLTLLYSTLYDNNKSNHFINFQIEGRKYGYFDYITNFLLKVSFNRIILELIDYTKKLNPEFRYVEFYRIMKQINNAIEEPLIIEKINDDDAPHQITLLKEHFDGVKSMMALNLSAEQIFNYCIKTISSTDVNLFLKHLENVIKLLEKEKQPVLPAAMGRARLKTKTLTLPKVGGGDLGINRKNKKTKKI